MLTSDRLSVSVRSCFGTGESASHTEEFHGEIGHHVTTQRAHLWWQITVVKDACEISLTWDHHVCARVDQGLEHSWGQKELTFTWGHSVLTGGYTKC